MSKLSEAEYSEKWCRSKIAEQAETIERVESVVRELLDDQNTHRLGDKMRDKLYSVITTTGE